MTFGDSCMLASTGQQHRVSVAAILVCPFCVLALSIMYAAGGTHVTALSRGYAPPHCVTITILHCTCGDVSPADRSLSTGLTESEMPLSSSAAAGSSLSESDPHVESHSSTVLGSLKRQLPNRFPI